MSALLVIILVLIIVLGIYLYGKRGTKPPHGGSPSPPPPTNCDPPCPPTYTCSYGTCIAPQVPQNVQKQILAIITKQASLEPIAKELQQFSPPGVCGETYRAMDAGAMVTALDTFRTAALASPGQTWSDNGAKIQQAAQALANSVQATKENVQKEAALWGILCSNYLTDLNSYMSAFESVSGDLTTMASQLAALIKKDKG